MYCKNCGSLLDEGDVFCTNCGEKIEKTNNDASKVANSEPNTTNTENVNEKNGKSKSLIVIIILVVIFGAYLVLNPSNENTSKNESIANETTSENDSFATLPEWNVPELEPAKIKEDAYAPEATNEYSYNSLKFKLPDTYSIANELTDNEKVTYRTDIKDNIQYLISISKIQTNNSIDSIVDDLDNGDYFDENTQIVNEEKIKEETINGRKWYAKKVELKSTNNSGESSVAEYYYTQYENDIYIVSFVIGFSNNKYLDSSATTQFFNIKQSLKF